MIVHCVFSPLGAFALSLQCRALPTEAAVVVPWAVWLGSPILQGLAFAVVQVWHQVRRLCSFFAFFTAQFRSVSVGCVSFALADVADQAWDSSLMTRMIIWLLAVVLRIIWFLTRISSTTLSLLTPNLASTLQRLVSFHMPFGYGDVHQLLQTSAGERKTVLRGVWCVLGLSSRLFSVHLKSARGNSCVLEFAVSVLRTLVFTLPLVDDPTSGLFSFSGVAVIAHPESALVAPAVAPPACSSKLLTKSTSVAPLDVWHRRLGHPCYDTLSQLKSHVRDFVVTGSFRPDKSLGPGYTWL